MPLAAGSKLGPYEILAPIGAGGMGEVYRARDPKLKRDVALKVLPNAFANDPDRLARFTREAQVLASLNHPNIAQIYGVAESENVRALVMELVEGESPRGPLPFEPAWRIASQIAGALEYAHDKGIVHRDLKPANVKATPEGVVKLLDFGLAKAFNEPVAGSSTSDDQSNSPTITLGATVAGTVLGTAGYMAPEQAKGKRVDKRADIWAWGVVLYELLTGERLFKGEDAADTLAQVLTRNPDLDRVPVKVRHLLRECLQKDPSLRLRDIGDAKRLLAEEPSGVVAAPVRKPIALWAAAGLLGVVAALGWLRPQPQAAAKQNFVLSIVPPRGTQLPSTGNQGGAPLLSPDGEYLLSGRLLRNMNALQMEEPPGIAGIGGEAFWSPDSRWLGFPVASELRKIRVPDGAPESLGRLPGLFRGGAWKEDGTILAASADKGDWALYVLPPGGAAFQRLTVPGLKEGLYSHPEFLPGSSDFLFAFRPSMSNNNGEIYLATLEGSRVINPVRLMTNETAVHYAPAGGGRILFVRNDNLYSQRMNLRRRVLVNDPELLQTDVASATSFALADFSVSRSGLVAWRPGKRAFSQITEFDRKGNVVGTTGPPSEFNYLRLSPDETHLLGQEEASGLSGSSALLERGRPASLALGPITWFLWSPDGSELLGRQGSKIVARSVNGAGDVRTLAEARDINFLEDISPDGKVALYTTNDSGNRSVFSVRLDGAGAASTAIVRTGEQILNPRFSPDGRWIIYDARGQTQRLGVFVQPFPGPGLRKQISSQGFYPVWRKDGREIVYVEGSPAQIWSVQVNQSGAELHFGSPLKLFPGPRPLNLVVGRNPLEISRDGSRIFFPQAAEQQAEANVIHVKASW